MSLIGWIIVGFLVGVVGGALLLYWLSRTYDSLVDPRPIRVVRTEITHEHGAGSGCKCKACEAVI